MQLLKRLWSEEHGQGLIEYTFVVLLVALSFWLGVRNTGIGDSLANSLAKVAACVLTPFSCSG